MKGVQNVQRKKYCEVNDFTANDHDIHRLSDGTNIH